MTKRFYQPRCIIPTEEYSLEKDPNRRIYSEKEWNQFKDKKWFKEDKWDIYELRSHAITEKIPGFAGWTPHYDFDASGFTLEEDIDLIRIGKVIDNLTLSKGGQFLIGSKGVRKITSDELAYGNAHAGGKELFEKNRKRIEATFNRLNEQNIEFIVFRTYRGWPAVWDDIYFYSLGGFKEK